MKISNAKLAAAFDALVTLGKTKVATVGPYTFKLLTLINATEAPVQVFRSTYQAMIEEMFPDAKPDADGRAVVDITPEQKVRITELNELEVELPDLVPITFEDAEKAGVSLEPLLLRQLGVFFKL